MLPDMDLPSQPPPDVPAPPSGREAIRSRPIRTIAFVLPVAFLLLLAILIPLVLKNMKSAARVEALSDLREIGRVLLDFESRYGKFPDDSTLPGIRTLDETGLIFGTKTSNDYFRQLLATVSRSEKIFFTGIFTRSFYPDDILGPNALEKDECSFSYIPGLSSSSAHGTPVVMTPLVPGTQKFDPKPFGKMATVLFVDGSVRALPIDKNGDVILNGMNLFDPRQPFWRESRRTSRLLHPQPGEPPEIAVQRDPGAGMLDRQGGEPRVRHQVRLRSRIPA
jgi:prepilin-type processing-associated H-X9-DG protein